MKRVLSLILAMALIIMPISVMAGEGEVTPEVLVNNETIEVLDGDLSWGGELVNAVAPETGKLIVIAKAEDSESDISIAGDGEGTANGNEIVYTLDVKKDWDYEFYMYGGKADHTGKVSYSIIFVPETAEVLVNNETIEVLDGDLSWGGELVNAVAPETGKLIVIAKAEDSESDISIAGDGEGTANGNEIVYTLDVKKDWDYEFYMYGGKADHTGKVSYSIVSVPETISGGTESGGSTEGTKDDPISLTENETVNVNTADGCYYKYFSVYEGELTFRVTSGSDWAYYVQKKGTETKEVHSSTDTDPVSQQTVTVGAFETYIIWVKGDFSFKTEFAQPKAKYVKSETEFVVGKNDAEPSTEAETVLYEFTAPQSGIYKFETAEGILLGNWGNSQNPIDATENKTNTLSVSMDEGQSVMIGVTADKSCQVTITRTGDKALTADDFPWVSYENKNTPEKADVTLGSGDKWAWVNVLNSEKDKAVLGADGYYHLNSADGPVLYVDLTNTRYNLTLKDMNDIGALRYSVQLTSNSWERVQFKDMFNAYYEAGPVCPLTDDLIVLFQKVGAAKGWYTDDAENVFGKEVDPEEAWMFACKYVKSGTVVDVKIDGVDGTSSNTWKAESNKDVVITLDADITTFSKLYLDGKLVPEDSYTVAKGSIIITLKADYLKTLSNGEHTFAVSYKNGTVSNVTLNVTGTIKNTGDASMIMYVAVLLGAAFVVTGFATKKKFVR